MYSDNDPRDKLNRRHGLCKMMSSTAHWSEMEITYVHGVCSGPARLWNKKYKLSSITNFSNNKFEGERIDYYYEH